MDEAVKYVLMYIVIIVGMFLVHDIFRRVIVARVADSAMVNDYFQRYDPEYGEILWVKIK